MRHILFTLLSFCFLCCGDTSFAQEITAAKGSYGIDKKNKIIVWHQKNLDSVLSNSKIIKSLKFNEVFTIKDSANTLSYTDSYTVTNGDDYTLYITKMPLIHITINSAAMDNESKIPGYFSFFNANEFIESTMGVRHRGNLSLTFPKKSFDLEFWTDSISKEKKDVKFKGMRNDDDWILDGLYNEPLRLRSTLSTNIWNKIHQPYYAEKEPKAKSGFEVEYVEVFKNNEYYGLYALSESVDRKQLKLKKHIDDAIYGELYKANSYKGGPDFTKSPEFNNLFPHWNGWRTEYPFINYTSEFKNLATFQNLVVNGTDQEFLQHIEKHVKLSNAIDYYLFINMVRATDNMGKNYYLGKYDKDEPFFFIPWDLDGVMGIIQDGKRERMTKDVLGNGLFNRLIALNPNGYKEALKKRWTDLRASAFSTDVLLDKVDKTYTKFTNQKVYEREHLIWKENHLNEISNEEHYAYLKSWIEDRLHFLDTHFNGL
ncbi:CotH kinase family protein [Lacinutrix chionoecetis]